jgi:hypothetical protein
VVGYSKAGKLEFDCFFYKAVKLTGSIKKAILGVNMKMYEIRMRHKISKIKNQTSK